MISLLGIYSLLEGRLQTLAGLDRPALHRSGLEREPIPGEVHEADEDEADDQGEILRDEIEHV